ncbi:MAG: dihydroorotate dehydrogenase B catalytic subunit [SAR202 cluster bacterium Io17-Chloro-G2]|nr:MAG: dihydroorotate dehydrogenase B catalytic subunit [SAR202 cluster bacterium Io17-Chloro-G2]
MINEARADPPVGLPVDLSVDLAPNNSRHLHLANPVMIASGTLGYDGYGRGITPDMDLARLGAVIPKTVTRQLREGNPEPRWYPESFRRSLEAGESIMLNSIGLANPGVEAALADLAPQWQQLQQGGATILLSLSADSPAQFGEMAAMSHGVAGFQALELNLSCPNIESGALFSHSAKLTSQAVSAVKAATGLPVLVKLAPNVPDITEIAVAAVEAGADALTISNTLPAMKIDLKTRKSVLGAVTGGLSGEGLRPVSVALVYHASRAVDVPIIGVGGIFTGEHALEYILAGATAVQIGSANLADLWSPFRILDELKSLVSHEAVSSLGELTGAVNKEIDA